MRILPTVTLLSLLALPAAARADTFTLTGSGGGFSGSATLTATNNGGGSFTITSISGSGSAAGITLIAPGGFDGNDNLLFPASTSVLDTKGFAFSDTVGTTSFKVDIAQALLGGYQAFFLDSDGFSATIPVTFSVAPATPEPSNLLLLGTGVLALVGAGMLRRQVMPAIKTQKRFA